jgi:hypothetical protein
MGSATIGELIAGEGTDSAAGTELERRLQICRPSLLLDLARNLDARNTLEHYLPAPTSIPLHLGSGEPNRDDTIANLPSGHGIIEAAENDIDGLPLDRRAHALLATRESR